MMVLKYSIKSQPYEYDCCSQEKLINKCFLHPFQQLINHKIFLCPQNLKICVQHMKKKKTVIFRIWKDRLFLLNLHAQLPFKPRGTLDLFQMNIGKDFILRMSLGTKASEMSNLKYKNIIVVNVNSRIKNKKKCGSKKEIVDYLLFVLYV